MAEHPPIGTLEPTPGINHGSVTAENRERAIKHHKEQIKYYKRQIKASRLILATLSEDSDQSSSRAEDNGDREPSLRTI